MIVTPTQISQMKEDRFQKDVLIPLFRAMKFKAITAHDGGSLELGKDLARLKPQTDKLYV